MEFGWKKSLRVRIGIIIVSVTTLILGVYTVQQFLGDKDKKNSELVNFAQVTCERLANSLAYSMFTYNKTQVAESVISEMAEQNIYAIIVRRDNKSVFFGKKRNKSWEPVEESGEIVEPAIKVMKPIIYENVDLGTVELFVTKKFVRQELTQLLVKIVGTSLLTNVALLLTMFVSMNAYIVTPVNRIAGFALRLKDGDLSERLPEGDDEIGKMSVALNDFVDELKRKAKIASEISEGNLRQTIKISSGNDILGNALQEMINSLNNIVKELLFSAEQVDAGSHQVLSSSNALSESAAHQAASIQQTVATMAEIGSQTTTNAEKARQAHELATIASSASHVGVKKMNEMIASMQAISDASMEISKIIKTIDSIAFQTNLLALNAAVEAARAGKHGKGFAVVALEVRNLAARSAKAAQDTADLIENSTNRVNEGSQISSKTAEALSEINASITMVTDLVGDIASASNEQAHSISQVNTSLSIIDDVTRQNTSHAEETSAASEQLSSQALQVRRILSRFSFTRPDPYSRVFKRDNGFTFGGAPMVTPAQEFQSFPETDLKPESDSDLESSP